MTIRRTTTTLALTCITALTLAACSGGENTATTGPTGVAATASQDPSEPPSPTPSSAAGEDETVSPAALCDYLTSQLPDLRAIGSEVGVMANLTANLFGWYDQQGAVPSGSEIDTQTAAQCPDVGSEVLTLAGIETFTSL